MTYGLTVWDRLGEIGTETSELLGRAIFADYIPYIAPVGPEFLYNTVVLDDVIASSFICLWYPTSPSLPEPVRFIEGQVSTVETTTQMFQYIAADKTFKIRNNYGTVPSTLFVVLAWV